jgi:hypothetical protein
MTLLREIAASEAGLPPQLAGRVNGESIGEMRRDAQALALDLGYAEPPEPQPRNERGQFKRDNQRVNDAIRSAAGYPTSSERSEPPIGDIGVGRGGAALPSRSQPPSMNDLIRATRGVETTAIRDLAEQLASERVRGA